MKLDQDEFEFVCNLINQRIFDLEDGETKYPKTDWGRQAEAEKLESALEKLSENQIMDEAYDPEDYRVGKHYEFDDLLEIARFAQECASCALQASYLGGVEERKVQRQNLTENMLHRYEHLSRCIKGEQS
tara:strand:+ start:1554 stop:1943 length:390 start_codon:yes stop_codon:yes gene_type:complete